MADSSSANAGDSASPAPWQFQPGNPHSFRKGVSGNLGGRSKAIAEVERLALARCPEAVERLHYLAHHARSERAQVAACEALLSRGMGRPAVRLTVDAEDKPAITTIQNLIVRPDGSMAEVGGFQPSSPIDRATASDAELVASDGPAETGAPGPEGETSSVDLRRVLDVISQTQAAVEKAKRELGQDRGRLMKDARRLTEAEERQRRERDAQTRPNGSADSSGDWY